MKVCLSQRAKLDCIALLGAVPASLAFQMNGTLFGWSVYILAFFAFVEASTRDCIRRAALVGGGAGVINFGWMLFAGDRFTGKGILLSVGILFAITALLAMYLGLIGGTYQVLKRKKLFRPDSGWNSINALILASIFVIFDFIMTQFADGFSLVMYVSYIAVATDLYAIQPASIFGPLVISFVVVFVNGMLAHILYHRVWNLLIIPVGALVIYYSFGFYLIKNFENSNSPRKSFKAAIIAESVVPEFKWNNLNGSALVNRLFELTRIAVEEKIKVIIWSETVIPWNFKPDDPFLLELSRMTSAADVTNLIGMNTDYDARSYYNSIYCLQPNYKITGRYDKRLALALLEKPFWGVILPFYSDLGFQILEGKNHQPLLTPVGAAGILLCNESTVPYLASRSVAAGAQFLVNPGNDGWFSNTYIAKQHFYHARLRAVETRRDIIINNNLGYVGIVKANGTIEKMEKRTSSFVSIVDVHPNRYSSIAVKFPYLFASIVAFLLFCLVVTPARWIKSYED